MHRVAKSLLIAGALASVAVPAGAAAAHRSDELSDYGPQRSAVILRSTLVGNQVTDPGLFGVLPGTNPWVLDRGRVVLTAGGQLDLRVRGLVIPTAPANGTNPVPALSASVACNGAIVASTAPTPFSKTGNAHLVAQVALPKPCLAPAVVVHPNTVTSRYIAANGSR